MVIDPGTDNVEDRMAGSVSAPTQEIVPRVVILILELYLIGGVHHFDADTQGEVTKPSNSLSTMRLVVHLCMFMENMMAWSAPAVGGFSLLVGGDKAL